MAGPLGVQALVERYFPPQSHPYRIFQQTILEHLQPGHTVLEIGCGRGAPNLVRLKGRANKLIGIDVVDFEVADPELLLLNRDVCDMSCIASASVDLSYSRSVMEHIKDVQSAYSEISRILRPGGKYIFLTPSAWDYASIAGYLIPNRFHSAIVRTIEGRDERDVFPVYYRSNTFRAISRRSNASNFRIEQFKYLGQYPGYLTFNRTLFRIATQYERFLERHPRLHALRGWILCLLTKSNG